MATGDMERSSQMATQLTMQGVNQTGQLTGQIMGAIGKAGQAITQDRQFNQRMDQQGQQFAAQQNMAERKFDMSVGAQMWREQMADKDFQLKEQEVDSRLALSEQYKKRAEEETILATSKNQLMQMKLSTENIQLQAFGQKLALYQQAQQAGVDTSKFPMFSGFDSKDQGEFGEEQKPWLLGSGMYLKNGNPMDIRTGNPVTPDRARARVSVFTSSQKEKSRKEERDYAVKKISAQQKAMAGMQSAQDHLGDVAVAKEKWKSDPMNQGKQLPSSMKYAFDIAKKNYDLASMFTVNLFAQDSAKKSEGDILKIQKEAEKKGIPIEAPQPMGPTQEVGAEAPAEAPVEAAPAPTPPPEKDFDPLDPELYGGAKGKMFQQFLRGKKQGRKAIAPGDLAKVTTGSPGDFARKNTPIFSAWLLENYPGESRKGRERFSFIQEYRKAMKDDPVGNMPSGYFLADPKWEKAYNELVSIKSGRKRGSELSSFAKNLISGAGLVLSGSGLIREGGKDTKLTSEKDVAGSAYRALMQGK